MFRQLKKYKIQLSVMVLIIFYTVGLAGMLLSDSGVAFARLSWLNLLISAVVLFANHDRWTKKMMLALIVVGILGFGVEVIGVQSGVVFGEYWYGDSLGVKWHGVPSVIGLNWVMLCYFSVYTFSKWIGNKWLVSLIAAVSLVSLDLIIEPVAVQLDFWMWADSEIPFQNYVAWFFLATLFNRLIVQTKDESKNKIAPYLFVIQLMFFLILRLSL